MEILHQLGDLFLASAPTVVILLLFYLFMRWSFFAPIEQVMEKRKASIEGSRQYTESLRAAAKEKEQSYQEALRKTRAEVFAEQEAARRGVLQERNIAIHEARSRANDEVQVAKRRIAAEIEAARKELELSGGELAEQIAQMVLTAQLSSPRPADQV